MRILQKQKEMGEKMGLIFLIIAGSMFGVPGFIFTLIVMMLCNGDR